MNSHGRFTTFISRVYYVLGAVYYGYKWMIIGGIAAPFFSFFTHSETVKYCIPAVSIGLIGGGISFWRRIISYQFKGSNPCLRILQQVVSYREVDEKTCESLRLFHVKALNPVNHYKNKFSWSGCGTVSVIAGKGVSSTEVIDPSYDASDICNVKFERMLGSGEELVFEYCFKLEKATKPLKHYFGQTIHTPMKGLVLKIQALPALKVTSFFQQIFVSSSSELPVWEGTLELKASETEAVWNIPNPRFGYFYKMSWAGG